MTDKLAIEGGPKAIPDSVHKPWPHITEDDRQAVLRVLQPGGMRSDYRPQVAALEKEWAEYVGTKHCIATNSGTSALHISVAAAGIGPGDEVHSASLHFRGHSYKRTSPQRHSGLRRC